MRFSRLILLALLPLGCTPSRSQQPEAAPQQAPREAVLLGKIQDTRLVELSGLAASRRFPGWLWAHNDSGDSARLFLLDGTGKTRAVVNLEGVTATDWEDIAVVGNAENSSVIVADSGDNTRSRDSITLHRFSEMDVALGEEVASELTVKASSLRLRYPEEDGAQDCEAIAASSSGDILLVTKSTSASRFYVAKWPKNEAQNESQTLKFVAEKQFGSVEPGRRKVREQLVTGADLSSDGSKLAVITYASLYVWKLPPGDWGALDWKAVIGAEPASVALPKLPQCESVAWLGDSLAVSSEGEGAPLWKLPAP